MKFPPVDWKSETSTSSCIRGAELGEAIRRHRTAKRLTQEQLAELAESHWTYVSEIENGHRNPGVEVLRRISAGL